LNYLYGLALNSTQNRERYVNGILFNGGQARTVVR
jgi:hypothetical protein